MGCKWNKDIFRVRVSSSLGIYQPTFIMICPKCLENEYSGYLFIYVPAFKVYVYKALVERWTLT